MPKPIDPSRPIEIPVPVDLCFEPLPDKRRVQGPPRTVLDSSFKLPRTEATRQWARSQLAMEPMMLQAVRYSTDRRQQAEVLLNLSLCHFIVGDLHRGRALTDEALPLWEQLGDSRAVVEGLMRAAHFHQTGGDVRAAIVYYERVLSCPLPTPYLKGAGRMNVLMAIAELHTYLGESIGVVDAMRRSLDVAREAGVTEGLTTNRMWLCIELTRLSRWQEALDAGLPALADLRVQGDREHEQSMRFLLADIYKELGRHREAAEQFEELLRQARAARAPRTLMIELLLKGGMAWRQAGEPGRAEAHFREALPLADAEPSRPVGVVARLNLAPILCDAGHPEQALRLLHQAMQLAPKELRSVVLLAQGEAHLLLKQWEQAVRAFQQALALARQRGDAEQEAAVLARLQALRADHAPEPAAAN